MTTIQLINALTEINDEYILECDNIITKSPTLTLHKKPLWWPLVACLSVIILTGALLSPLFKFQDSSANFTNHYFKTYEDFASVLPPKTPLRKLAVFSTYELQYLGTCQGHITDNTAFTKPESYQSFTVLIYQNSNPLSTVQLTPNSKKSAEKIASLEALSTTYTINETTVYYAYNNNENYYKAVFSIDNDLYTIEYKSTRESSLLNLIDYLLK